MKKKNPHAQLIALLKAEHEKHIQEKKSLYAKYEKMTAERDSVYRQADEERRKAEAIEYVLRDLDPTFTSERDNPLSRICERIR